MRKTTYHIFEYYMGVSGVSSPVAKIYEPFPTAPVFTNPTAITTTTAGKDINNTALASKLEATMSPGQTANISTTFTVGTAAAPVKFKSLDPNNRTIIGDGTVPAQPCFRGVAAGSSRHVQLYDFILYRNQGGLAWPGNANDTNPSTIFIQNIESHRHDFAGYWVNTANGYYARISSNFYRYFELDNGSESAIDGGEGLYIGHTTITTRSKITESIHRHLYGLAAARDGVQVTGIYELEISNATIRNSGTFDGSGQNRLFQDHSCWGKHVDCIYDGSTSAFEVQGTNKIFYNCLFKYMNSDRPYIGGFTDGLGAGEPQFDGEPIIFDNCIFKTTGTGTLLQVQLKACDVIVRNCIISDSITSLFLDSRGGGATNSLIDGGGNTFVTNASIPDPTYEIEPDFDLHITYADTTAMIADQASQSAGRRYQAGSVYYTRKPVTTANISDYIITIPAYVIADDYYYNRGMGYRTPANIYTPTDITISATQIAENNSINDVIATLAVVGGSGSYTFTVQDNGYRSADSASFNTLGNSLRASEVYDLETKSQYYVRIRAASVIDPMRYFDKVFSIQIVA